MWLTAASISALFAGCLTTRPSHGTIEADHADAREQQRVPIVEAPLDRPTRPSPLLQAAFPLQTIVGLCEDYPEESRSIDAARRDFTYTRAAGGSVLRIAFGWDAMEPKPDEYDWSFWDEFVPLAVETYGIKLIPYVCYTPAWAASEPGRESWRSAPKNPADFEEFMALISLRYGRWIDSWEIWNEPDNEAYWSGTPEQYAELVRAGSRGVRRGDPGATIVLGGLAWDLDYLRELLEIHDVEDFVDVINVHSYFETWHEDPIEDLHRYLEEAAMIVHAFGDGEPLWMAEVGYSSRGARRPGVTELYRSRYYNEHTVEYQAAALARTLLVSLGSGRLSLLAWYRINDLPTEQDVIGDDHNRHLGIVDVAGKAKPALRTLRWLSDVFRQPYRIAGREMIAVAEGDMEIEGRHFSFANGERLVAVWLPAEEHRPGNGSELQRDERRTTAKVTLPHAKVDLLEVAYAPARPSKDGNVSLQASGAGEGTTLYIDLKGGEVAMVLLR